MVSSIYWKETPQDNIHISYLDMLSHKYELDKKISKKNKYTYYNVKVGRLYLLWYGNKQAKFKIKSFLFEAGIYFGELEIKYYRKLK